MFLAQLELQKASVEGPSLTDGESLHVSYTNRTRIILYQQSHAVPVGRLHIPSRARLIGIKDGHAASPCSSGLKSITGLDVLRH
ncbi:hypothetical protein QQF64_005107 [Cirrhinus molitorella]|uniref:Uncharacterized protein n=1 Tax=Cirrhinus molitorella TaxID=172907 RepID=A0ABR3MI66_9TELE